MANIARKVFMAYPATPHDLTSPITAACAIANETEAVNVTPWPQLEPFGSYIPDEVRGAIEGADIVFADITRANLNVYYEVGYAVGQGKSIAPVVNISFSEATSEIRREGLFDNIGYETYENSDQLSTRMRAPPDSSLTELYSRPINHAQPIYFVDTLRKTDFRNAIASAIKASRSHYRSFDPLEVSRVSLVQLVAEVTASSGVVIPYLADHVDDAARHNLRAAVVAGLAHGLGRRALLIKHRIDDGPRAADYNDLLSEIRNPGEIQDLVSAFCSEAAIAAQSIIPPDKTSQRSDLQKISLGASAAENEFRTLRDYFVETSEFLRAVRGEVSVITGRKGSGKSAIFFRVRDSFRTVKRSVVVDLKPESHQLSVFREELATIGNIGIFDHTIAAFWYFVILSETLLTIYRSLEGRARYDGRILSEMREIEDVFTQYRILEPGDFTTRLTRLSEHIAEELRLSTRNGKQPSLDQLTNLVFRDGIGKVRALIVKLSDARKPIVFLFDNIDKGWPPSGVNEMDVRLVRLLLETLGKVRRDFSTQDREFISMVFLRNDIYELLVDSTPDRGKSAQVAIDWTDRAKLTQVIYRRLQAATQNFSAPFPELWTKYFPVRIRSQDSFEFMLDHCLMRPRFLINVVEGAISTAINRGHTRVDEVDCEDAVRTHSLALIDDFGFEIRDVSGLPSEILYSLVGCKECESSQYYIERFAAEGYTGENAENAFELMLWYGLLGVRDRHGVTRYIYDFNYNRRRLAAETRESGEDPVFCVNPSLFAGLSS